MSPSPPWPAPWPAMPPAYGTVLLRAVDERDLEMARELSTDPYIPATGSLPLDADEEAARAWVGRQQQRHGEGAGFSFTIVERKTDLPIGHCGLWFRPPTLDRASVGYSIVPSARGRGNAADALRALTAFAWTVFDLHIIDAYIEPGNDASMRVAERAGYARHELLREHQLIGGRQRDVLRYSIENPTGQPR